QESPSPRAHARRLAAFAAFRAPTADGLKDLPDRFAVAQDVADGAVVAALGLFDRLPVGTGEDVLLLDDDAAGLGQLVHAVQLHATSPGFESGQGRGSVLKGKSGDPRPRPRARTRVRARVSVPTLATSARLTASTLSTLLDFAAPPYGFVISAPPRRHAGRPRPSGTPNAE